MVKRWKFQSAHGINGLTIFNALSIHSIDAHVIIFFQESDLVQLNYNLQSPNSQLTVLCKCKSGDWETVEYVEQNEDELKKEWICVRTQFHLKYCVNDSSAYREELLQLLQSTRSKICETNKPILKVCDTEIVLKKDKGLVGIGKNAKISAAVQQTKANAKNTDPNQFDTLNIELSCGEDDAAIDDIGSLFSSKQNFAPFV